TKGAGGGSAAPAKSAGTSDKMAQGMMEAVGRGLGGVSGGARQGQAQGGGSTIADPKFNPDDELGPGRALKAAATGGGEETSSVGATSGMKSMQSMGEAMMGGSFSRQSSSSAGGWSTRSSTERYVEEKPEWKTCGFEVAVLMDQRRVPDLLVELTNSEGWP